MLQLVEAVSHLARLVPDSYSCQRLSQFECLDCFFNSLASVSNRWGRSINGSEGPLNYSTRLSFSRWVKKRRWKGDIEESFKEKYKKKKNTPPRFPLSLWDTQSAQSNRAGEKNRKKTRSLRRGGASEKEKRGETADNEDFINQRRSSDTRSPCHCWSHYQFRRCDVLKNAWLCKLSHSLPRRDNRMSHTARAEFSGGNKKKKNNGRMRSHAAAAGKISGRLALSNQCDWAEWLDFGFGNGGNNSISLLLVAHCAFDIYRHTYKKEKNPASVIKHWEDKNVSSNERENKNVMRMSMRIFVAPEPNKLSSALDFTLVLTLSFTPVQ